MSLLIFYLTDANRHYTFDKFINLINKSLHKTIWKLLILTSSNDNDFYIEQLNKYEINYEISNFAPYNNYLNKVNFAVEYATNNKFDYMMKCDNDIFIKEDTLDFMINNLNLLENKNNLTITPVLTSGIPSVEYFIEQFLDETAKNKMYDFFLNTKFDNEIYLSLNSIEQNKWDKKIFFEGVRNINHYFMGIHPIRVNRDAIDYLNEYIIKNKDRFLSNLPLKIIDNDNSPYLCNSIFCIKTNIYREILNNKSLFVDIFDEVPLNKYCEINNMKHLYVENGFAIHMYYNWSVNHLEAEKNFVNIFSIHFRI